MTQVRFPAQRRHCKLTVTRACGISGENGAIGIQAKILARILALNVPFHVAIPSPAHRMTLWRGTAVVTVPPIDAVSHCLVNYANLAMDRSFRDVALPGFGAKAPAHLGTCDAVLALVDASKKFL